MRLRFVVGDHMKRRDVLLGMTATFGGALALPKRVWASSDLVLGDWQVQTLSDGYLTLPGDFILGGMPQDELTALMARYNLSPDRVEPPCNITLARGQGRVVLFDIGAGHDFMSSAGQLPDALDAAGLAPEDITDLVITHGHPDHLWGILDDFDDPYLPNAAIHMGRAEFDYWTDPDTVGSIGEARASFAIGAARRLDMVAQDVQLFDDGAEILPGIQALLTPGHTPGHMAFHVAGASGGAVIVGDALGNHHVAFERPDWASGSDQDAALAANTRRALLDRITADNLHLIGFHLPEGGIGRAERRAQGSYIFTPGA